MTIPDQPVAASLAARWQQTVAPLLPAAASEASWQYVLGAYAGPARHYHALPHLATMFAVLDAHPEKPLDPAVLELAVWFHDAVYDPLRHDNEARSAEAALQHLQGSGLAAEQLVRLDYLIRRTQHHARTEPNDGSDTALLLDADLWVLGAEPAQYAAYARQVRREYRLVPKLLYRHGRANVLRHLLEAPQLYRTRYAQQQREAAARRNLAAELQAWETGRGLDDLAR
ncbi:hypothetical protein D3Y59_15755 [Hymenobacter oligotrophus]|uniref:N-methyl-D-aspartate receptor NMDAR2C subunit n=1 Tax=Hymenobacter oligotrophus TaxID=2319843 RepID=A0A3B7R3R5_9BACT|nr:hypothetical protein [Hymenobacter oligotrophus]AYA38372.1 hypothetical protein D3Y59_15755 [Hymenobacter oligotrophus]